MTVLGLFVKHPLPGRVKTRLAESRGEGRAAEVYAAFVADLAARFRSVGDRRLLCYSPDDEAARQYFASVAGGAYELWPQPDADLGTRMRQCFEEHIARADDRIVIIGSDSPTLPREYVERAFDLLREADCVLGPAADGGYYLIGQRGFSRPLFDGIAWSGPDVLNDTVARIAVCGARLALLPVWYDVDSPADWRMLAGHVRALSLAGAAGDLPATRACLQTHLE
jgi:rSAM/selenodomain-associated transferase 1